MNVQNLENNIDDATILLKALSNDKRLTVLCAMVEMEKSVGELERIVDLSQSALSQHLARLRRDGLVTTRREAQTIYYSIKGDRAKTLLSCLQKMF